MSVLLQDEVQSPDLQSRDDQNRDERRRPLGGSRVLALIPAFQPRADELATTLSSMLGQTYPVDICLIDDGSTPPVELPEFARGRVHVLRLPRNGGITVALRAGAQLAYDHGYEFVCRLDVGDRSYAHRVQKQLEFLEQNSDVDLVGAFARVVDTGGTTLFYHGVNGGPSAVAAYLRKNSPFRHSTFFMRTKALVESGSYNVAYDGAEDYELLVRLARRGRIDCHPQTLVDYVTDPAGISGVRRGRQLRKRLAAQLVHLAPFEPAAYAGAARTLLIMLTPSSLIRRLSISTWRRRGLRGA